MSDFSESSLSEQVEESNPEFTEVDEARRAHRRLFTLGLLSLVLAIVAFFFPRCDFDDDDELGGGLSTAELVALVEDECAGLGEAGPAGQDGAPGDDGAPGLQGPAGEDGQDGETGGRGPAGQDGAPGEQGEQGPAGQDGEDGAPGPQGEQGEQGEQGPQGEPGICDQVVGPPGPQGEQGEPGPQGEQGLPGPVGPQGVQGVQGEIGPAGPRGPAGPAGGFGAYGSFWDQCTQLGLLDGAGEGLPTPMLFSHTGPSSGVSVPGADEVGEDVCQNPGDPDQGGPFGSPGGSVITFSESGVYNIQFSAQYFNFGTGTSAYIEVWIRENGVDVPWTNTHFYSVANSVRLVSLINWFVEIDCDAGCDDVQIMWRPVSGKPEDLILLADPQAQPEIPSIILTVNQVG